MSALLLLAAVAQTATRPPVTLHVGDPAPAITVVKWLKGSPQTNLKDGKVHVVEFWATWCGPCKVGMPHLSELAKRYGNRVAFAGIDASERQDDVTKPEAFVRHAGPMMDYNVAYATPKGAMSKDWMQAAGQYGIPCSFVVDRQGRIGWIGHPLMGLEQAVDLALEDRLSPDAAARVAKEWDDRMARGAVTSKAADAAEKAGKIDEALTLNQTLIGEWPFAAPDIAATKYGLLTAKDEAAAEAFGAQILREQANAPYLLRAVATTITDETSHVKGARDYRLARALLQQSNRCISATVVSNGVQAKAEYCLGHRSMAVKIQQTVVAALANSLQETDYGTSAAGTRAKAQGEKSLSDAQLLLERYKGNATAVDKPKA